MLITTKTINYSITKGTRTNSVNATITSTPGFNMNALKRPSGYFKIIKAILAILIVVLLLLVVDRTRNGIDGLMVTELFIFSVAVADLQTIFVLLCCYLSSTTSWILVTRTTRLEVVLNVVLAVVNFVAGAIEIGFVLGSEFNDDQFILRLVAGVLAIVIGIIAGACVFLARRDLKGTRSTS